MTLTPKNMAQDVLLATGADEILFKLNVQDGIDPQQLHDLGLTHAVVYRRGVPVAIKWDALICDLIRIHQTSSHGRDIKLKELAALGEAYTARLTHLEDKLTMLHADLLLRTTSDTGLRDASAEAHASQLSQAPVAKGPLKRLFGIRSTTSKVNKK